jgi:triosephosphate isomerase
MHLRRKLVAGNWKMNGSLAALVELGPIAEAARAGGGVDVAICPPFTLLAAAVTRAGGAVTIGAQDCHAHESGAHTG